MISKETKISKMLTAYPQTLPVLLGISPHFKTLEDKELRKSLAGRVSVEQAAEIAGVDLQTLLTALNNATGSAIEQEQLTDTDKQHQDITDDKPAFLDSMNPEKIKTLDVRPLLESGQDPIDEIKAVALNLAKDEIFLLINSFAPVPLYKALKNRGLRHWTEQVNDEYRVYFYRDHIS